MDPRELWEAIRAGDVAEVQKLLAPQETPARALLRASGLRRDARHYAEAADAARYRRDSATARSLIEDARRLIREAEALERSVGERTGGGA